MPIFDTSEKLKAVLGAFFKELARDPAIKASLLAADMVIRFNYREPDASITIIAKQDPIEIRCDVAEPKPDVEMSMKADTAHEFWLGKVNLPIALTRRQIVAKGSIPKILKLLPVIKPAYALYPAFLKTFNSGIGT